MKKLFYILSCLVVLLPIPLSTPAKAYTRYETGLSTSASLLRMKDKELDKRLSDIKNLGATWIRVEFSWYAIQPDNAHDYNWDMYDRLVRVAGVHHLKILALLAYPPHWARDSQCESLAGDEEQARKCSPRSNTEFGHFAAVAANRYKTKSVRGWEIWNEPNLNAYWKTVQPDGTLFVDPIAYAHLANITASQIRRYTDAAIITGGMSPLFEPTQATGMRQSNYLAALLPHLNHDLFNGVGIHPYTWPILPSKNAVYNAFYTVDNGKPEYNLRTIMARAGWSDKQIWGTEFGASTVGLHSMNVGIVDGKRPDHVTENRQAQIVQQGLDMWYSKKNVGPLIVHSDSDQWLYEHKNEGGFGLRRTDGTKKPAYDAFQKSTEQTKIK